MRFARLGGAREWIYRKGRVRQDDVIILDNRLFVKLQIPYNRALFCHYIQWFKTRPIFFMSRFFATRK